MTAKAFLLLNVALGFYNVGTIWAHEVDIFRSWRLLDSSDFHRVQLAHWRRLPYWVFAPVGAALIGSIALVWIRPVGSPSWAASLVRRLARSLPHGTHRRVFWGPWQAKLSGAEQGSNSPYLARILQATHWIRTLLINAYAIVLLIWALQVMAR